jgi:membrane-bound lytic murein transglycosylase MltF
MKNVWLLVLACICMTACRNRQQSAEVTNYDLPQIKDSGELVVLTLNSSTSYFDYRGEPMGFQYELADQFARHIFVGLNANSAEKWDICLDSEFDTLADVNAYAVHPDHVAAAGLLKEVKADRACVDYEF